MAAIMWHQPAGSIMHGAASSACGRRNHQSGVMASQYHDGNVCLLAAAIPLLIKRLALMAKSVMASGQ